ncbi:hypothetical protein [Microbacterium ulmi]|uniref:Capsular polysaccharide biosynthesis protein n=1 Tax=Microbacterium ulmi TaxID=179095 RepID=A0A7Y2PZG5_9MICO|nr:hypothetical protein [Microbacterium ulmi]NII69463.1 capsular polysaccharide biosynthesis protein [Microbacterium ulmi]NNH04421.1 hypothetical protein [Microbacterium ulmi]
MDTPKYLQVLWSSKWLLVAGAVVAAVAAFFAGFTFVDGELEPRAEQEYTAQTTLLVSSPSAGPYQAVMPGQTLVEGQTQPQQLDLTTKAILYAYVISGDELRKDVEAEVGELLDTDGLTAVQRTTQPSGNEEFPGRYSLPIVSVVGTSLDPDRAEEISRTAASLFEAQVLAEQDAAQLASADRVVVTTIDAGAAEEVDGSNPAIPLVITFLGVFLLFVAAAYVIAGARSSRRRRAATTTADSSDEPDGAAAESSDSSDSSDSGDSGDRPRAHRSRRRTPAPEDEPVAPEPQPEPAYVG